jgi:hypothetical protein
MVKLSTKKFELKLVLKNGFLKIIINIDLKDIIHKIVNSLIKMLYIYLFSLRNVKFSN